MTILIYQIFQFFTINVFIESNIALFSDSVVDDFLREGLRIDKRNIPVSFLSYYFIF